MVDPRRWEIVYDEIRAAIDEGRLRAGDRVPTEIELAESHGISRQTVRVALGRLERDGLITPGAGRAGRRVREYRPVAWHLTAHGRGGAPTDPPGGVGGWDADIRHQRRQPSQTVSVAWQAVTGQVAGHLGIPSGQTAVCRTRLRIVDGVPVALAHSWFPSEIATRELAPGFAPLLADHDPEVKGGILRSLGIVQTRFVDEIRVRMSTPDETVALGLESGSPVGEHTRVGYDVDGRAVRVIVTVFAGHRLFCTYTLDV